MKRRLQGLASSVKAVKKRSWREEEEEEDLPESSDEKQKAPKPPAQLVKKAVPKALPKERADSEDELDQALDAALEEEQAISEVAAKESQQNPVVWMDISVAGKPRGRLHFELYRDVVPETAENFRRLCRGVTVGGRQVGYKNSELHKVLPGRLIEGGEFDCSATGNDFADESFKLMHTKGGLLSMCGAGPDANSSRFQVVLRPSPELDNKQVVFGHVLPEGPTGNPMDRLHVLHWVEAVGNVRTGTTRESVVVEDCGEYTVAEAAGLVAAPRPPSASEAEPEIQSARYERAGLRPAKLADALHRENLNDVLELTADALDSWEWEAKKAQRSGDIQERGREINAGLKPLGQVLEEAKYKAGTVQGEHGEHGRKAQSQQLRLKELQETIREFY